MARRWAIIASASSSVAGLIEKLIVVGPDGVVAFAGLALPVLIAGLHFDLPERAILGRIGGRVAERVLAAHLLLQLGKGFLQWRFAIDMEHVSASILGHL